MNTHRNPQMAEAMRELRKGSRTTPVETRPHYKHPRGANKARAIREGY